MQVECKENFDISKLTTFKVGGKVAKVYFPKNQQELIHLLNTLSEYIILGNCSNVLISSQGYKGNIILTSGMSDYSINGAKVSAECGVKGPMLSQKCAEAGLCGFEFMIGFPGTVGGEICMNASAHGQAISDKLIKCCLFDAEKKEIVYKEKSEMGFGYRTSLLQGGKYILLSAEFELMKGDTETIKELMNRNLESRKEIQPNLSNPNAGSVFRNPENDSAGRLLDKAGCKGMKGNNSEVWAKHANFIVNTGNATSADILELMYKMYSSVKEKFTIELTPELIFIGDMTEKEEELWNIMYKKIQK